jgi:hypothetical protein
MSRVLTQRQQDFLLQQEEKAAAEAILVQERLAKAAEKAALRAIKVKEKLEKEKSKTEEGSSKSSIELSVEESSKSSATGGVPGGVPKGVSSTKGKITKKRESKVPKTRKKTVEEEADEEEKVQTIDLTDWKGGLQTKGKSPEMITLLVFNSTADFNAKWPKEGVFDEQKWTAVREIFIDSSVWVRKDQNVYLNEIRERALLFIVNLEDSQFSSYREPVKSFLNQLREIWIERICDCRDTYILQHYLESDEEMSAYLAHYNDSTFNQLERIGGRANYDFLLKDQDNPENKLPLELKFASTEKSEVADLVQFIALNLLGKLAMLIFGASYLAFFYTKYLPRMVAMFNGIGAGLTMPSEEDWIRAAAATSPPANSTIKPFFDKMRDINKDKTQSGFLEAKKTHVNQSFNEFIDSRMGYLNGPGKQHLQDLLDNQTEKYFCIFGGENGTVNCNIDLMPQFTVDRVLHDRGNHTFLIVTSPDQIYNIRVGLSWGNGGAGCNNPRAMFTLELKPTRRGGGYNNPSKMITLKPNTGMTGGGSDEIELEADDPEIIEENQIFLGSTVTLTNVLPIDTEIDLKDRIELLLNDPSVTILRNGKVIPKFYKSKSSSKGGRRKMRNTIYSKTKNVKSKKNKKNKFTKKYRNKSRNKKSKNKKYRNKMSKNRK